MKDPTREGQPQLADVDLAKFICEDCHYRHDLIWRLLFRMTTVAAVLSIAPSRSTTSRGRQSRRG